MAHYVLELGPEELAYIYDLEKELDAIEDKEPRQFSMTLNFGQAAIVDLILASWFFACLPAAYCICNGIFSHVYIAKAAASLFSSLFRITALACAMEYRVALIGNHWDDVNNEKPGSISAIFTLDQIVGCSNLFRLFNELLTLILMHELFQCTCKMQLREQKWTLLGKRFVGVFLLALLICGLEQFFHLVPETSLRFSLIESTPLEATASFVIRTTVVIFCIRVLLSISKSDDFRGGNASQNGPKMKFLIALIVTIIVSSVVKQAMQIGQLSAFNAISWKAYNCFSSLVNDFGADCESMIVRASDYSRLVDPRLVGIAESFCIMFISFQKNCKQCVRGG